MKSVKIKIPKGYKIQSVDNKTGEVKFESTLKITDRIKTIYDVLKANGLTQPEFDQGCCGLEEDEVSYRLIKLIAKALNEGWIADLKNTSQWKYFPRFVMGSSGFQLLVYGHWNTNSIVGSRLCFKTSELAIYAGETFPDVYEKFIVIE